MANKDDEITARDLAMIAAQIYDGNAKQAVREARKIYDQCLEPKASKESPSPKPEASTKPPRSQKERERIPVPDSIEITLKALPPATQSYARKEVSKLLEAFRENGTLAPEPQDDLEMLSRPSEALELVEVEQKLVEIFPQIQERAKRKAHQKGGKARAAKAKKADAQLPQPPLEVPDPKPLDDSEDFSG